MIGPLEVLFDAPLLVGEGPTWCEKTGELYFVDIRGRAYFRMEYRTGKTEKTGVSQMLGCLALCEDGGLLLSMEDGVYKKSADGRLHLAHQPLALKGERFNDGKVGPDGCYYVGTAGENFSGALYRLQDGVLTELFDGCGCSNGLDWSPDGKTVCYIDSPTQKIEAFDFADHAFSARRTVAEIPKKLGVGDGMTVDAEGNLWVAVWGGGCVKHVEASTGRVLETVSVPARQVSSCCFAGDDLCDLIITTAAVRTDVREQPLAGRVFRCRTSVGGRKINYYRENTREEGK